MADLGGFHGVNWNPLQIINLLVNSSVPEEYLTKIVMGGDRYGLQAPCAQLNLYSGRLKAIEISNIATADGAAYLEKAVFGIIAFA